LIIDGRAKRPGACQISVNVIGRLGCLSDYGGLLFGRYLYPTLHTVKYQAGKWRKGSCTVKRIVTAADVIRPEYPGPHRRPDCVAQGARVGDNQHAIPIHATKQDETADCSTKFVMFSVKSFVQFPLKAELAASEGLRHYLLNISFTRCGGIHSRQALRV
jgi:hypothetical protein